ncbi:MAG: ATP-binding cassette subfamily B protein [Paracrocinitomix sp.]|jgi:ABC-type multidrug transport system fused ATPase/permease subunit
MGGQSHWRALLGLVTPHRKRLSIMIGVLSVAGALPLLGPLLIASFIDEAEAGAVRSELLTIAGIYVGVGIARQILSIAVAWTATDLSWRVTNELRLRLTRHVLNLDLAFHRSTSPGELVSRVDGDVTALSDFIASFAVKAAAAMVTLVGLVVVLLFRDWQVGLGLAVYLGLAISTMFLLRNKAVDEAATEQAATGRMLGEVEERLTGADDLRSNGGGSHAVATFQEASAAVLRSALGREKQGVTLWIISNAVFVIGGLIALAVNVSLLRRGSITLGTAYLIFQYTQILRAPLSALSDETERVQRAAGGMARTLQLLDEESVIKNTGTVRLPDGPLSLTLDQVTFTYGDEDTPVAVIDDLTLTLPAGTSIGVLGRTGSGKTTLARLLLRLVEPTQGTVRLGGVALGDVPLSDLRARTGVVSQDVHLFGATIRDNLTLFDETITDDQVRSALAELDLLTWIEAMPNGLDTELGPAGNGLSAGEGQLIALARLFLRSPDFVLLDEASSRIDPLTEQRVTRAIDRLLEGRTALVIAHRLSTVERLDEILVLDTGKVVERGATADLRDDPNSRYAQLLAVGSDVPLDDAVVTGNPL